jgi:hypothetical protein
LRQRLEVAFEATPAASAVTEVPRPSRAARARPPRALFREPGLLTHLAKALEVAECLAVVGNAVVRKRREDAARELGAWAAMHESACAGAGSDLARVGAACRGLASASRTRFELGLFRFVIARRHGANVRAIVLIDGELEAAGAAIQAAGCDHVEG